ncbi:MAG: hypothetical protein KGO81_13790, partial [Bacteroidota bacterium]|nr:hypothetical protein [Bacteroidota bacterium]
LRIVFGSIRSGSERCSDQYRTKMLKAKPDKPFKIAIRTMWFFYYIKFYAAYLGRISRTEISQPGLVATPSIFNVIPVAQAKVH